ncbi:bifunctional uridylate/adenylate kinase [Turnera subulata]|uniref:adenylate kinase n=1 Tax=Turnera subulata TaxID=218843 RepID=A0A9Q0JPS5_9ROSI|nr:bifunctional uridylate/adenylate kinase [Turnera subulata]
MKIEPALVLFFHCPEEELTRRLLNRNQGRIDDNIDTIPKRLKVYFESTLPVIHHYSSNGKIDAGRSIDEVFEEVKRVFLQLECGIMGNSVKE